MAKPELGALGKLHVQDFVVPERGWGRAQGLPYHTERMTTSSPNRPAVKG